MDRRFAVATLPFQLKSLNVNGDFFLRDTRARFPVILQNFSEHEILWSLCSVVFRSLPLKLAIHTSHPVAPELQVSTGLGENCPNFSKTSTLQCQLSWPFLGSKL